MSTSLSDKFWDESIWCPPGLKWSDYETDSAQFGDLKYSLVSAVALLVLRFLLELILFRPIGRNLCKTVKQGKVIDAKQSTVKKFAEGSWRISFYSCAALYGWFGVLWDKPYKNDTFLSLINFHTHPVENEEWWYYNIEMAFYISLLFSQFIDTKRKDFWQMFVHHIVTVLLLIFSWASHYHRIGCLVMAIHDVADVPLEGARMAKYCNKQKLADFIFAIFTVVWIYTRCYLLPKRVLYYSTYAALEFINMYPAYYIFNGLLCCLQLLHFVWTYIIIKIAIDALQNNGVSGTCNDVNY